MALDTEIRSIFTNLKTTLGCIVPIGIIRNKNHGFEGTGIYAECSGRYFFLTAGHIAANAAKLVIQTSEKYVGSIPATEFHSFGDPADVAVAELNSPLECYTPINGSCIRYLRTERTRGFLNASGYPSSKVKVSATKTDAKLYSFLTFEEDRSSYPQYGMNPTDYLVLNYDKENMMGEDLKRMTTPDPIGISGGGLFLVPETGRFGPATPLLVGIMTGWDKKSKRFLATQISVVSNLMRGSFGIEIGNTI